MASCSWVRCRAAARAPRVVAIATALLTLVATLAVGADAAAATSATTPSVRLLHVTPVVRRAGQPVVVTLTRTGPATASGATVQLTLYSRLTTRSALLAAISAPGPSGPVSTTGPLVAGCLTRGATLSVGIPVAPDGVAVAPHELCGRAGPVLRLGPSAGAGVYPLRVTVRGGGATATIDTLVTYATTASPSPLLVAWIVRVAGGKGQLAGSVPALAGVAAHPTVPLTVDVQGSTLAAASSSSGGVSALKTVVGKTDRRARQRGLRARRARHAAREPAPRRGHPPVRAQRRGAQDPRHHDAAIDDGDLRHGTADPNQRRRARQDRVPPRRRPEHRARPSIPRRRSPGGRPSGSAARRQAPPPSRRTPSCRR